MNRAKSMSRMEADEWNSCNKVKCIQEEIIMGCLEEMGSWGGPDEDLNQGWAGEKCKE